MRELTLERNVIINFKKHNFRKGSIPPCLPKKIWFNCRAHQFTGGFGLLTFVGFV